MNKASGTTVSKSFPDTKNITPPRCHPVFPAIILTIMVASNPTD
jgi:hypothetical protein